MKIDRNWYLIAIAVVLASILLPFMQVNSFVGGVVDSEVVYRDGWFGPYIERVTLDNGGITYVGVYPWYYFKDFKLSSLTFTDMVSGGGVAYVQSNELIISTKDAVSSIPITFSERNDLYLTGRFLGIGNGPQVVTRSNVVLYPAYDEEIGAGVIAFDTDGIHVILPPASIESKEVGPWEYEDEWSTVLTIPASRFNWNVQDHYFGVTEVQYAKPSGNIFETGYETDWAKIQIQFYEDATPEVIERGTGTITVTVNDNQVPTSAHVDVYKNGALLKNVYIPDGRFVFNDLEFGAYKFVVIDSDYDTMFYDANPSQLYFDYDIGEIELSPVINAVSYRIYGNFEGSDADPSDGLDDGWFAYPDPSEVLDQLDGTSDDGDDGTGDDGDDGSLWDDLKNLLSGEGDDGTGDDGDDGSLWDDLKNLLSGEGDDSDDGSLSLTQILGMIAALLSSMGLLASVAIIGLPVFIVVILFLLVAAWVKSGDKKTNYSPGNKKKGGRK